MKTPFYLILAVSLYAQADASKNSLHRYVIERFVRSQEEAGYMLPLEERPPSYRGGEIPCVDGKVTIPGEGGEEYACDGIDLSSFISSEELLIPGVQGTFASSDIWGWTSPEGREITLLTLDTGIVFIDSTTPTNPCIIAKSHSARPPSSWGDVKVVNGYAYTIKDERPVESDTAPGTGMEIYDLFKYAEMECPGEGEDIPLLDADFITTHHGKCHNVVSNTETERIYAVGCRQTCDGGLVILDVSKQPLNPPMIGCVFEDGYTHDAQCVKYSGPDQRYNGREVCFAFNEDTLTIWDVTEAADPKLLSRIFYENQAYSHQGWLNKDMTKIMLDDELDEICNRNLPADRADCFELVKGSLSGKTVTTTNVFDVTDLTAPFLESVFEFGDQSIDHNLYEWGTIHQRGWSGSGPQERIPSQNVAYMHNYMAGLRVVDISSSDSTQWEEVKFFDITDDTVIEFFGVWSGYMFPTGHYVISSIEKGVFFLNVHETFDDAPALPVFTPNPPATEAPEEDEEDPSASPVLYVFFVFFLIVAGAIGTVLYMDTQKEKKQRVVPGADREETL